MDVVQFAANMYPDTAGPYIPVLYQLRLEKLTRSYKSFETEVTDMEKHTMRIGTLGGTWIYLKKNCSG